MGKSNKKKKKRDRQAFLANKHDLYQKAVQEPEADTEFMEKVFRNKFKNTPLVMREDFCGTANTSCEWVRRRSTNIAVAIDLEQEILDWAQAHNVDQLKNSEKN